MYDKIESKILLSIGGIIVTNKKYGERIIFRVDEAVFKWWEAKCKREGVKKGEPFQKAIEAAYLKDHEKKSNDPEAESPPEVSGIHLNEDIKAKLKDEAIKANKSESDLLNEILQARYTEAKTIEVNALEKTKFTAFRLKPSFLKNVEEAAKKNNMRTTKFVVAVLTAKISSDEFFFNEQEAKYLGESNSQLLAIGRNLNQMAKNMNQDIYEAYDRQFIINLNDQIKAHVRQVFSLLERNKKMWE